MDPHAPFLAEICARPDEDAPRLIYADWLEEQGDPRAGSIRWQCAAAQLPEWHPARAELELRAALAGGVPGPSVDANLVSCGRVQRGFACEVRVEDWLEFARIAEQLFAQAPIDNLRLPASREALHQAANSPHLRPIRELRIDARMWVDPARAVMPSVAVHVSQPPLAGTALREVLTRLLGSATLAKLERLTLAGLHESPCEALGPVAPRLTQLTLSDILLIGPADIDELCTALAPAPLASLTLAENRLGDGVLQLARESLAGLETLRIQRNALSRLGAQALVNSPLLGDLRRLELDGNRIAVPGIAALSDGLGDLVYLSLAENRLGTHAVQELALARGLTGLEGLKLAQNGFGPDAFRPFQASHALPRLRHLDLSLNAIDSEGLAVFLNAPLAERLESLDLSCNPLDEAGARLLAASPALQNLEWLNLAAAKISAAGARALAESASLAKLRYLNLQQNPLEAEGRRALEERFPCSLEQVFAVAP